MLLVAGARQTMDYLAKCASVIGSAGEQVKWVTPLNLPIMQPYKRNPAVRRPGPPFLRNVAPSEVVDGVFRSARRCRLCCSRWSSRRTTTTSPSTRRGRCSCPLADAAGSHRADCNPGGLLSAALGLCAELRALAGRVPHAAHSGAPRPARPASPTRLTVRARLPGRTAARRRASRSARCTTRSGRTPPT